MPTYEATVTFFAGESETRSKSRYEFFAKNRNEAKSYLKRNRGKNLGPLRCVEFDAGSLKRKVGMPRWKPIKTDFVPYPSGKPTRY